MSKNPVSFRITTTAKKLLAKLARHFGISKTAIVEIAIREKADRHDLVGDVQFLLVESVSSKNEKPNDSQV